MQEIYYSLFAVVILSLLIYVLGRCCSKKNQSELDQRSVPIQARTDQDVPISVSHLRYTTSSAFQLNMENDMTFPNLVPLDEHFSPPPYSVVPGVLPPSYDEAIKQQSTENVAGANATTSSQEANKY